MNNLVISKVLVYSWFESMPGSHAFPLRRVMRRSASILGFRPACHQIVPGELCTARVIDFRVVKLALLVLLPLTLFGQGLPAALKNSIDLMQRGQYEEAQRELLRATREAPESAEAFFLLGTAETQLHHAAEAEAAFRRSLTLKPKSPDTLYNLGVVLLDEKRPREAIRYFEQAAALGHARPELSVNLIRARLDSGDPKDALKAAGEARKIFRNSPAFHLALGKVFLAHGMGAEAVQSLKQADALAQDQPEILFPLADACLRLADAPCVKNALEHVPGNARNSAEFHFLDGRAAFLANRKDDALREMETAVRREPRNVAYLLTLARYCQKYGDQKRAVDLFEQAARIDPELPDIPYGIAVSYFIGDDFDAAADYSSRALKLDATFDRAVFLLGISRFAKSNLADAERLLSRAIELRPDNAFYACFHGMILISTGKLPEAALEFHRAIQLQSSYALPHYQLGRVLVRTKNYTEARLELERAISLDPDLPEAYYQLGLVYTRLGEREKAARMLAVFKKYRTGERSERTEVLQQAQHAMGEKP